MSKQPSFFEMVQWGHEVGELIIIDLVYLHELSSQVGVGWGRMGGGHGRTLQWNVYTIHNNRNICLLCEILLDGAFEKPIIADGVHALISSTTSHSDVKYIESLWTIHHYVMRPMLCAKINEENGLPSIMNSSVCFELWPIFNSHSSYLWGINTKSSIGVCLFMEQPYNTHV